MTATPPGWPGDLPGPGAGLAEHVTGWLLDRLPPEYRTSPLRRYPLVLAMCARLHAQSTLAGTRDVYRDLRAFLNFCVREGWLETSPLANVKPPRVEKRDPEVFTPEQVQQIIQHAGSARNRAVVLLLLDTGLRGAELCNLAGRDIDMQSGAVHVRMGKGRKNRTVYAGAHARRALARYFAERGTPGPDDAVFLARTGNALTYGALSQMLQYLGQRAGFRVTAHNFRRTFATEALRNGWDVYTLRDAMGHEDITVLRHYVRIAGSDVERSQRTMGVADSLLGKRRR